MHYNHALFCISRIITFIFWKENIIPSIFFFQLSLLIISLFVILCVIFFRNEQKILRNKSSCNVPWTHFLSKFSSSLVFCGKRYTNFIALHTLTPSNFYSHELSLFSWSIYHLVKQYNILLRPLHLQKQKKEREVCDI